MVDKQLSDYIKNALTKGYKPDYIEKHLIKHGYKEHDAREAVAQQTKKKEKKPRHSHHLLRTAITIIMILLAVSLVLAILWYNSDALKALLIKAPTCDCEGQQICLEGVCEDPQCGLCEILVNYTCVEGECCRDLDCDDGDISTGDRCSLDKTCLNDIITECIKEDGYCPEGCTFQEDSDCDQCAKFDTVQECGIGMHCMDNTCLRNQELSSFTDCDAIDLQRCETIDGESFCPEQGTCNMTCNNCIEPICVWGANKCVECLSDSDCIDSVCEYYVCV